MLFFNIDSGIEINSLRSGRLVEQLTEVSTRYLGPVVDVRPRRRSHPARVRGHIPQRPCLAAAEGSALDAAEACGVRRPARRGADRRVALGDLAGVEKKARREWCTSVFIDESGFYLLPVSSALLGDAPPDFEKDQGDGFTPDAGQLCDIRGRKIHREVAQDLAELTLGNSGTRVVAVSPFH